MFKIDAQVCTLITAGLYWCHCQLTIGEIVECLVLMPSVDFKCIKYQIYCACLNLVVFEGSSPQRP